MQEQTKDIIAMANAPAATMIHRDIFILKTFMYMCSNPYFVTRACMNEAEYLRSSDAKKHSMLDNVEWDELTIQQRALIIYNIQGQLSIKRIMMSWDEDYIKSVYQSAHNCWNASEKGEFSRVKLYSTPIPPRDFDKWNHFVENHYRPLL
jgi:hypothetical protein